MRNFTKILVCHIDFLGNALYNLYMTVAERIRHYADNLGLTYEELERRSGVSRSALQRYATGACEAPVSRLEKIAAALNTTAPILLGWTEGEDIAEGQVRAEWNVLFDAYKAADERARRIVRCALEVASETDEVNSMLVNSKIGGGGGGSEDTVTVTLKKRKFAEALAHLNPDDYMFLKPQNHRRYV